MGRRRSSEAELAAAVAGHYAAAGDQPAALRATVQAALAARDVHAYGEAAELAERALDLWPRVPEPSARSRMARVDLLRLAASAHSVAGDRDRAEVLLTRALDEVDKDTELELLREHSGPAVEVQWSLNRGSRRSRPPSTLWRCFPTTSRVPSGRR